ncbi:MAG: choline/ethanolamine kinase family protein [Armatimonadota bacterium]|nr:choline/ethanolamine kinase family protein [Armatimonadota bacterium]MDR7534446.1 choline/ethanolamine kinase family protein [Armatimonadota bacterium]MDR7535003.1 choline/ethanolamine kinase family protein [Armatimonadota bacterium]
MCDEIAQAITRIPAWRTARAVRIAPLAGGLTNRTYRVDVDGEAFVVRLLAPAAEVLGIDRQRERACALAASRAGAAPEVVHVAPEAGLMVTRFVPGRTLAPGEPAAPAVVRRVVAAVRCYHESPPPVPGRFSPLRTTEAYLDAARARGVPTPGDLPVLTARLAEVAAVLESEPRLVPCHNDLWGANLVDDGARVWIVDWEYAGLGDPYFDLATFAIYHAPGDADDAALLTAYFGGVTPARMARLKLMRLLAEMRDATWYLAAQALATSAPDFAARADAHFARYRRALDDPRLPAWLALARDA